MEVNLNNLICDTFKNVAMSAIKCEVDRVVLNGGRNTTKSQVASIIAIVGCMLYKQSAVAIVKYGNKVYERLVSTFQSSMAYMGVEKYWKLRKSPFEYVLLDKDGKETNVSIKFTGCDDPENIKSYRARGGSTFRYVWLEELTNFSNIKEVNNIVQTMARGEGGHCIIMTYNPPQSYSNWVNKQYDVPIGKILGYSSNEYMSEYEYEVNNEQYAVRQIVHHSTYLDVIDSGHANWLGLSWIGDAEKTKKENNKYYRWAYLGEVIGNDANVFSNIIDWDGNLTNIDTSQLYRGMDWGYGGPDPTTGIVWSYDRRNKRIYALEEFYGSKMDIPEIVDNIKRINKHNFPMYADSANPLLNQQLINKNLNIVGVKKYPDSVPGGIKWLKSLNGIYICKYKTPNLYREFSSYEYVIDKDGTITSKLPDANNHTIDATRYAFNMEIKFD